MNLSLSSSSYHQWVLILQVLVTLSTPGLMRMSSTLKISEIYPEDDQLFFYDQTLDHFNYNPMSYRKFQQRFVVNSKHWQLEADEDAAKANKSPIFVYLGHEAPLEEIRGYFIEKLAIHFKGLLAYIEHRYYGESVPFRTKAKAFKNANTLGYLSSTQAMADFAEIIIHIKDKFNAKESPVIVFGNSYSGSLAAWFRLKYPHIAIGALASSAPLLNFDDIVPQNGFATIVTNNFKEVSQTCHDRIKSSWSIIDEIASTPSGLSKLIDMFIRTFDKSLRGAEEIKNYLESMYISASTYRWPLVVEMCRIIDNAEIKEDINIVEAIFQAVAAFRNQLNDLAILVNPSNDGNNYADRAWLWQTCTELVMPEGQDSETMLESNPYDPIKQTTDCVNWLGIHPRIHWITDYNGGHDIYLILKEFGSNIIFSNGLRDPWSCGGVLKNISDTIVSVTSINGTHCQDMSYYRDDDPIWLKKMRERELNIIHEWISAYYIDLQSINVI